MINLALADIFIVAFGYPVSIQSNLRGEFLESSHCMWSGFVNGTVGITAIFTLTEMVVVSYFGVRQVNTNTSRLSTRQIICLIGSAWFYGGLCMLPPLVGWNRFVLSSSRVSCCPDWAGKSLPDTAYNLLLVVLGFFLPLIVMVICYYKIYSFVHRAVVPSNAAVQIRHRHSQIKVIRMTTMSVVAFVLSWSPYCFVSLAAVLTKSHVIASGQAEVSELFAKASVIYNPIVYTIMNSRFRATLFHILRVRGRRIPVLVRDLTLNSRVQQSVRNETDFHPNNNTGTCGRQRQLLQVPSFETGALKVK
ncbi:hypothetical protein ACROYT_G011579 [Oculina patagonica]